MMSSSKYLPPVPRTGLVAAVLAVFLGVDVALLLNLRESGLPIGLVFGLAAGCVLSVGLIWSLASWLRPVYKTLSSFLIPIWRRILQNAYLRRTAEKYPRFSRWLADRMASGHSKGLILTTAVLLAAALTLVFAGLAKDVLLRDEIVDIDQYLIQTLYDMRTPLQTSFFKFMTTLASFESMVIFIVVLTLVSWRRRALPLIFGAALAVAVVMTQSLKLLFGRLRPDEALRLVVENGFSFPSGHTFVATIIYGLAGYVLWRTAHSSLARFVAVAVSVTIIILVGCSRNYLGVHFPSDVLASLLFGSAILTLFITAMEVNERYIRRPDRLLSVSDQRSLLIALTVTALASLLLTALH